MTGDATPPQPPDDRPRVGVVVLTQGKRPGRLDAALASLQAQRGVRLDVVVVGNGWQPHGLPPDVRALALADNVGIPAGRNAGVDAVAGDVLFFLDDDACLPTDDVVARLVALLDGTVGLVQPRVLDPDGRPAPRRWVPRIRKSAPERPGPVFSVWEGAVALPRSVFEAAGRWPEAFFYAHEGIELAWRVWEADRVVWYAGDVVVHHGAHEQETRHPYHHRLNARNRVWLARRNLPVVLRPCYVASWTAIQVVRTWRRPAVLRAWFSGWWEGWRTEPPAQRPLRWRTVGRMTRHGRPPVV
jgi:GT2 family glycosyltransferase